MVKSHLGDGTLCWYYIICVLTLGAPYFLKIIIMKAIVDSQEKRPYIAE
jgi:hypothetical protein